MWTARYWIWRYHPYWQALRERLERELSQEEIVIRAQEIVQLYPGSEPSADQHPRRLARLHGDKKAKG
jgi:hypothetical protein